MAVPINNLGAQRCGGHHHAQAALPPGKRPSSRCTEALKHKTYLRLFVLETSKEGFQAVLLLNRIGPFIAEFVLDLDATDDFYCRSYCLLNMLRAPLCPSSGAREYYTSGCCLSYLVFWFSSCRYGVELRVMCPVCGLLLLQPAHINDDALSKPHQICVRPLTYFPVYLVNRFTDAAGMMS